MIDIVTPSIIPTSYKDKKFFNIGDYIVLGQVLRFLSLDSRKSSLSFNSYWDHSESPLSDRIKNISSTDPEHKALVVAGTNVIRPDFSICRSFDSHLSAHLLEQYHSVALLFVGIFGADPFNQVRFFQFRKEEKYLFHKIFDRGIITTRCNSTHSLLLRNFPENHAQILNTGCIASLATKNIFKGFKTSYSKIAFSFTARNSSIKLEIDDLIAILSKSDFAQIDILISQARIPSFIYDVAHRYGLNIVNLTKLSLSEYYQALSVYDLHIGSRAHVHIPMISMGIPSLLTGFESRHSEFQKHYGQNLLQIGSISSLDFSKVRSRGYFDSVEQALKKDFSMRNKARHTLRKIIELESFSKSQSKELIPPFNAVHNMFLRTCKQNCFQEIIFVGSCPDQLRMALEKLLVKVKFVSMDVFLSETSCLASNYNDAIVVCLSCLDFMEKPELFFEIASMHSRKCVVSYNALIESSSDFSYCMSEELSDLSGWKPRLSLMAFKTCAIKHGFNIVSAAETKYSPLNRFFCEYLMSFQMY